jgi:hypothetical protein
MYLRDGADLEKFWMWLTPGSALKVKMEVFAMSDTEVYSD